MVRPGVHRDFVASHVLSDEDVGVRDDTRANDEERRREIVVVEVLQQFSTPCLSVSIDESSPASNLRSWNGVISTNSNNQHRRETHYKERDRRRN